MDKISRVRVVGVNAADPGCGQEDMAWPFFLEKCTHNYLVHEIQGLQTNAAPGLGAEIRHLAVDGAEDVFETLGQKGTDQGATDHAGRSGYEDFVCFVHLNAITMHYPFSQSY